MNPRPCHVLVIDNDQDVLHLLETLLREEGHRVDSAFTAEMARGQLAERRPGVVISDLSVWSTQLTEALELLGRATAPPRIPVLVCTAWSHRTVEESEQLRSSGFDLLYKPFDVDDLLAAVARLCQHAPDAGPLLGD